MVYEFNETALLPRDPNFSLDACLRKAAHIRMQTATPLTGGLINYVWRITDERGQTYILKHAEAAQKFEPSIENSPARLAYEARGMRAREVREACAAVEGITVPEVVAYESELHTLIMTDGGRDILADVYKAGGLDMRDVGERLARWTAALHMASRDVAETAWENPGSEQVTMMAANALPECMERHGYERRVGEVARDGFFALRDGEPVCYVQGDFRPGNILVGEDNVLSIIDWEDSRRQSPAVDLRLFAAQAYLLDVLHGERGLLKAFLTTYKRCAGEMCTERVSYRTAVMLGTFLLFWLPQMDLCNAAQSAELACFGAMVVDKCVAGDVQWLRQSRLGPLFA
jgi:aminoglycoside phosphotransferase (APT) family kinase protein